MRWGFRRDTDQEGNAVCHTEGKPNLLGAKMPLGWVVTAHLDWKDSDCR